MKAGSRGMNNPRVTSKERGLLKGAIRRVFSRSDLRRKVIELSRIDHTDSTRPRVKKWSKCASCNQPIPTYLIEIDHVAPIIPINNTLEKMSWDSVVDNTWCTESNLMPVCKPCHRQKTKLETRARAQWRKCA
jgi:5-methylcytosine-specific restriction endonuclease McrA